MMLKVNLKVAPTALDPTDNELAWRNSIAWPIAHSETKRILLDQTQVLTHALRDLDDDYMRQVFLLSVSQFQPKIAHFSALALLQQAAEQKAIGLSGSITELAYLKGDASAVPPVSLPVRREENIRWPAFRRIARTASWTRWYRLPAAVRSSAWAVSHNPLMVDILRKREKPVSFIHAEEILQRARANNPGKSGTAVLRVHCAQLASKLASAVPVGGSVQDNLHRWFESLIFDAVEKAIHDIEALRSFGELPPELWHANGGAYATRALALEVIGRGGRVFGVEHGGTIGTIKENAAALAFTQFSTVTDFYVATSNLIPVVNALNISSYMPDMRSITIHAHDGDPGFIDIAKPRRKARDHRLPPRVLYATTAALGPRQVVPPSLPDAVYLDWSIRLVKQLSTLPIELTCRPHPEGLYRRHRHPLSRFIMCAELSFEELVDEADVCLFDYPLTTTFWKAICSSKPVILIDFGIATFSEPVKCLLNDRVQILKGKFDENNLPIVETEKLSELIFSRVEPADAGAIQKLFTRH